LYMLSFKTIWRELCKRIRWQYPTHKAIASLCQMFPGLRIRRLVIYKTGQPQDGTYTRKVLYKTCHIPDMSYTRQLICKTGHIQDWSYRKQVIYKTQHIDKRSYTRQVIYKTDRIQDKSYTRQIIYNVLVSSKTFADLSPCGFECVLSQLACCPRGACPPGAFKGPQETISMQV
jgi:hypothetical protein